MLICEIYNFIERTIPPMKGSGTPVWPLKTFAPRWNPVGSRRITYDSLNFFSGTTYRRHFNPPAIDTTVTSSFNVGINDDTSALPSAPSSSDARHWTLFGRIAGVLPIQING